MTNKRALELLEDIRKHLPGQHDQESHAGNRGGGYSDEGGEGDYEDYDDTGDAYEIGFSSPRELEGALIEGFDVGTEQNELTFPDVKRVETFEAEGVLTSDKGVVVHTEGYDQYQLSVGQPYQRGSKYEEKDVENDLVDIIGSGYYPERITKVQSLRSVGALTGNRGVELNYDDGGKWWVEILGSYGGD